MRSFPSKSSCLAVAAMTASLICLAGSLAWAWQNQTPPRTARDIDRVELEDQPVQENGWLTLSKCQVKLIDSVTLAPDRPGVIASVKPEEGDSVRKNQQIVLLKDEVAVAMLNVAKKKAENDVQIRYAKAAAVVAELEHEKMVEANRKVLGAFPAIDVEKAKLNWEKALLQAENAEHDFAVLKLEVAKAEEELKSFKVEAPFDGKVRRILKREGEAVRQGDPILELVSIRRVKVEGYLPIEDADNVKPGDAVQVQVDIPNRDLPIEKKTFEGKVVFIDPQVSPVTYGARVWAEVQNPSEEGLKEGMYTKMKILHGPRGAAKANGAKPIRNDIKQTGGSK